MATISGHSFNIGPYGKYVLKSSPLKPVSQFKANSSGSQDIILKVDHLRTIHAMFALNDLLVSEEKTFKHFFHRVL
jgi:hypothetical protein